MPASRGHGETFHPSFCVADNIPGVKDHVRTEGVAFMRDLKGKTVLVTGAAGGLGRELALCGAREGALPLLVDIKPQGLEETGGLLRSLGIEYRSYVANVSSPEEVGALAQKVGGEFGGLDILINNAGVFIWADFVDTTAEDWAWVMGVNLWSPIHTICAFLPGMIARGKGHIVNVASLGGLVTMPTLSAYSTSKFGLVGLTETLQHELEPLGISVTLVCPGNIRTPIIDHVVVRGYDREKLARVSFGLMPRMAPDRAASIIMRGVKKGRHLIVLTPTAHFMHAFRRLSPALYRMTLGRMMYRVYQLMR